MNTLNPVEIGTLCAFFAFTAWLAYGAVVVGLDADDEFEYMAELLNNLSGWPA